MRPVFSLLAFLLTPAALSMQAPASPLQTQSALNAQAAVAISVDSLNCPVRFAARRWNDASALRDVGGKRAGTGEHGLFLHPERNAAGQEVRFATVVVHGTAPSLRLNPAQSSSEGRLQQTFHLAELPRDRDGNWRLTADRVPLIQQIEITEVQFVDGTTWRESQEVHCRFLPDPYVPVASAR